MKVLAFLLLTTTVAFSQDVTRSRKHISTNTYHQAYLNCGADEMRDLVKLNASKKPNPEASAFFAKYPVLDSMDDFKRKTKYSLINAKLLYGEPQLIDNDLVFTFKNGKSYLVPLDQRFGSLVEEED